MFQSRKNNKTKGNAGEELAVQHLLKKGYKVLARNWFYNQKEIDIICEYQNLIVFIEVKARNYDYLIEPQQAVNLKKQRFIIKAANAWLLKHDLDQEARFDIVTVTFDPQGRPTLEHIEEAFYPFT